jgi:hypothetical protein
VDELTPNPIRPIEFKEKPLPTHLDTIEVTPPPPRPDVSVGFFTLMRLWIVESIKTDFLRQISGAAMDWKQFGVKFIVSLVMNAAGAVLGTLGISQGSVEEIVGGLFALVIGFFVKKSLVNAAHSAPPPR